MDSISNLTFGRMDKIVDEIVRNDSLSAYEKKIKIMTQVVGPLVDANEKLRKEGKEKDKRISDAGWQYEKDHADDWRKPVEMGML